MAGSDQTSRRGLLLGLALAPAAVALASAREARADVCTTDMHDGLPESLHFQLASTDPAKHCSGCVFWQATSAGATCATCQILSRTTPPNARCDSWTAKS